MSATGRQRSLKRPILLAGGIFAACLAAFSGGGPAAAQTPGLAGLAPGRSSGLIVRDGQAQGYGNSYFDPNVGRSADIHNGYAVSSGFSVRFGNPSEPAPAPKSGRGAVSGTRPGVRIQGR